MQSFKDTITKVSIRIEVIYIFNLLIVYNLIYHLVMLFYRLNSINFIYNIYNFIIFTFYFIG